MAAFTAPLTQPELQLTAHAAEGGSFCPSREVEREALRAWYPQGVPEIAGGSWARNKLSCKARKVVL